MAREIKEIIYLLEDGAHCEEWTVHNAYVALEKLINIHKNDEKALFSEFVYFYEDDLRYKIKKYGWREDHPAFSYKKMINLAFLHDIPVYGISPSCENFNISMLDKLIEEEFQLFIKKYIKFHKDIQKKSGQRSINTIVSIAHIGKRDAEYFKQKIKDSEYIAKYILKNAAIKSIDLSAFLTDLSL